MSGSRYTPHIFLLVSSLIFGGSYVIAKGLMPDYFNPMQIILVRVSGSLLLFTLLVLVMKKAVPERRDMLRFLISGLLGVTINQTLFFVGLNLSRPVEASIIHTTSPVWVFLIALMGRTEKHSNRRMAGIILGLAGALWMVTGGGRTGLSNDYLNGNLILLGNIFSYSIYLVIVRPLTQKYHPFVVMQWVFLFGWLGALPFCFNSFSGWDIAVMDTYAWFAISYVVIGATFLAFLLVVAGLQRLQSSTAAYYNYLQPLIAAVLAWSWRGEKLSYVHAVAALLIFTGVYLIVRPAGQGNFTAGGRSILFRTKHSRAGK